MAVLVGIDGVAPAPRADRWRFGRRVAIEFAALAAHGWDTAAQIAVFLWMALVVAFLAVVAAGFFVA
jgi:hypothetical protein